MFPWLRSTRKPIWHHGSWSILVQVMACCLMVPSHYLNQCWLIVNCTLWNKFYRNLNLANVICKMAAILFRPQCVEWIYSINIMIMRRIKSIVILAISHVFMIFFPEELFAYHDSIILMYCKISNIRRTKSQNLNFFISSCSCLCAIYWSQVLSRKWRCSRSSANRRCSNYIWVINNLIAHLALRCVLY